MNTNKAVTDEGKAPRVIVIDKSTGLVLTKEMTEQEAKLWQTSPLTLGAYPNGTQLRKL